MVFKQDIWKHSSEIPLRKSLYSALGAGVSAKVWNGNAPNNYPFPYVVIGESITGKEFVTKTSEGEELVITVHIFTQEEGYDLIDELTDETLKAVSTMSNELGEGWTIVYTTLDAGSRKWRYAVDKAQKILYLRFNSEYTN